MKTFYSYSQEFKALKPAESVKNALIAMCAGVKDNLYDSTVLRDRVGNVMDSRKRFQFHQENRSTELASSFIARYVTYCINDQSAAYFHSGSTTVLNHLQTIRQISTTAVLTPEMQSTLMESIRQLFVDEVLFEIAITSSCFNVGFVKFIVFEAMSANRCLLLPNTITRSFSRLEYILKMAISSKAKTFQPGNEPARESNPIVEAFLESCMNSSCFKILFSIHSAFKNAASTQTPDVVFVDHGDHLTKGGLTIRPEQISAFVKGHLNDCQQKMESLFGNIQLLTIPPNLKDNVSDRRVNVSLYSQNQHHIVNGKPIQQWFLALTESIAQRFHFRLPNSNTFITQVVEDFYKAHFQELALDLVLLMHITGGSPPRKTELALLRVENDQYERRGIYLDGDTLYFTIFYHKTLQQHDIYRPTYHFLTKAVSRLVFNFICVLRPMMMAALRNANSALGSAFPVKFIQVAEAHSPVEISKRFESVISSETGLNLRFREWRHLVQIYMRQELIVASQQERLAAAIDHQAGRSYSMGTLQYGQSTRVLPNTTTEQVSRERQLSLIWHRKLQLDSPNTSTAALSSPKTQSLASLLDSFFIPAPSQSPVFRHQSVAPDLYTPERIFSSLQHLYGPNAKMSSHMLQALQIVIQKSQHLFIHMQTGAGKSSTYMVPSIITPEQTTVVLVPLSALLIDTVAKLRSKGISAVKWTGPNTQTKQVVLAHYQMEIDERLQFSQWLHVKVANEKVSRVVFDEAHLLIDWYQLMNLESMSCLIGCTRVQLVFQSATLTSQTRRDIMTMFSIVPTQIATVNDVKTRCNLQFSIQQSENTIQSALQLVQSHFGTFTDREERVIVFVPTVALTTKVAEKFRNGGIEAITYHGNLEGKEEAFTRWKDGHNGVQTIVATKGMNSGVDYKQIHLVIVLDYTNSICDLVQSFGRAGRDNHPAKCVLLTNSTAVRNCHADKQLLKLFQSNECIRFLLDSSLYGWGASCKFPTTDNPALPCSRCATQMPAVPFNMFSLTANTDISMTATSEHQDIDYSNYNTVDYSDSELTQSNPSNISAADSSTLQTPSPQQTASIQTVQVSNHPLPESQSVQSNNQPELQEQVMSSNETSEYDKYLNDNPVDDMTATVIEAERTIRAQNMAGGQIIVLLDKMSLICIDCVARGRPAIYHTVSKCTYRVGMCCFECLNNRHRARDCLIRSITPGNRCWLCWIHSKYGDTITHDENEYGTHDCTATKWHGLVRLWAVILYNFKDDNRFSPTVNNFAKEVNGGTDTLPAFITSVASNPEKFLSYIQDLLRSLHLLESS